MKSEELRIWGLEPFSIFKFQLLIVLLCAVLLSSCELFDNDDIRKPTKEELDKQFAAHWNKPEYQTARTADAETYLTAEEKEIFYYLNLVRLNPPLFAKTYAEAYKGQSGWTNGYAWDERKKSLIEELLEMQPLGLIYPDRTLYESAKCFAEQGGALGLTGHDRSKTTCDKIHHAEVCSYGGNQNGLTNVMSYLIDAGENNAALGHRRILLDERYDRMGAAIQPHKNYKHVNVCNFFRR